MVINSTFSETERLPTCFLVMDSGESWKIKILINSYIVSLVSTLFCLCKVWHIHISLAAVEIWFEVMLQFANGGCSDKNFDGVSDVSLI